MDQLSCWTASMTMIINVKIDEELSMLVARAVATVAAAAAAATAAATAASVAATTVAVVATTAAATAATHFCFRIARFNVYYNRHIQIHKYTNTITWTKGWFNYFISSLAIGPSHHHDNFLYRCVYYIHQYSIILTPKYRLEIRANCVSLSAIWSRSLKHTCTIPYHTIQYNTNIIYYWFTDFVSVALFCV